MRDSKEIMVFSTTREKHWQKIQKTWHAFLANKARQVGQQGTPNWPTRHTYFFNKAGGVLTTSISRASTLYSEDGKRRRVSRTDAPGLRVKIIYARANALALTEYKITIT